MWTLVTERRARETGCPSQPFLFLFCFYPVLTCYLTISFLAVEHATHYTIEAAIAEVKVTMAILIGNRCSIHTKLPTQGNKMQALYPNKKPTAHWDTLNTGYTVRKFPDTGLSSETIARRWRSIPEKLHDVKEPLLEEKNYDRNYNVTNEVTRSQATVDYGVKQTERERFSKNTSCTENVYIYPPSRQVSMRPPDCSAHGTTVMRSSFHGKQSLPGRLVTAKEQFLHPASLSLEPPSIEPLRKYIEPLDTTHEGFEKYLDPYLTTSRLHHRPYTAEQLNRDSSTKDIMTYYTFSKTPWVRSPKPSIDKWRQSQMLPKPMYDRERFKEDFREIRAHNKLQWTPSSFRTETRDNYKTIQSRPESHIYDFEDEIRSFYKRATAHLQTNIQEEQCSIKSIFPPRTPLM